MYTDPNVFIHNNNDWNNYHYKQIKNVLNQEQAN